MKKKITNFMSRKTMVVIGAAIMTGYIANCAVAKKAADSAAASIAATATNVYNSTTSRGDLVSYTITGSDVTLDWNVTDATGVIQFTANIAATCGAQDATYGYRTCTISSATCTAGAVACPAGTAPSGTFEVMEIPGTAVIVHVPAAVASAAEGATTTREELHAGFISGGCPADVSGDYAYIKVARASMTSSATDLFGMYRTDATFTNVHHSEFGMTTTGAISAAISDYMTNAANLSGAEILTGSTCNNGVFTRSASGNTLRINATAGGTFILDLPAGQGGLISFKTTNAAAIGDLASRNWWGIVFPDAGAPDLVSLTSSTLASNQVTVSGSTLSGGTITNVPVQPASDAALATKFTAPTAYTTSGNALQTTYAAPANIPGLMQISQGPDNNIVAIASKVGSQVMLFGTVYNLRSAAGATCTAGTAGCIPRNAGNFMLFSH